MPDYTNQTVTWNGSSGRIAYHIRDGATSTVWMVNDEQNRQWVMKIPFQHSDVSARFRAEIEVVRDLQRKGFTSLPEVFAAEMEDGLAGIVMPYYPVEDQAFLARQRPNFLESGFFSFARQAAQLFTACAQAGIRNTDIKDENFYWLDEKPNGKLIVLDWNRCEDMRDSARDEKEMVVLVVQVLYLVFTGVTPPVAVNGIDPAHAGSIPRPLRRIHYLSTRGMLNFERLGQELKWWEVLAKLERPYTADLFEQTLRKFDFGEESEAVLDLCEMAAFNPPQSGELTTWMEVHAVQANWQQRLPIRELDEAIQSIRQDWEDFQLDAAFNKSITLAKDMFGKPVPIEKLEDLARTVVVSVWLKKLPLTILREGKKKVHSLVNFWLEGQPLESLVTEDPELAAGVEKVNLTPQEISDWMEKARSLTVEPFPEKAYNHWQELHGQLQQRRKGFGGDAGILTVLDVLETCLPVWAPTYALPQVDPDVIESTLSAHESPAQIRKRLEAGERQGDLNIVHRLMCLVEEQAWGQVLSWCNHLQESTSAVIQKAREYARERCIQWVKEKTAGTLYRADFRYLDDLIEQLGIHGQLPEWPVKKHLFARASGDINNEQYMSECAAHHIEPYQLTVDDLKHPDVATLLTLNKASGWVETLRTQMGGGSTMDADTLIQKAKDLVDKQSQVTALISSVEGINVSLADLDTRVSGAQVTFRDRKASVDTLTAEFDNLRKAFDGVQKEMEGVDTYHQTTLQDQISALTQRLNSLKSALDPAVMLQLAYTLAFSGHWKEAIGLLEYFSKVHPDEAKLTQAPLAHLQEIYADPVSQQDYQSWAAGLTDLRFDHVYEIIANLKSKGHERKPYFAWLFAITYTTQEKNSRGWLDLLRIGEVTILQRQLEAAPESIETDYLKNQLQLFNVARFMMVHQTNIPDDMYYLMRLQIPNAIWEAVDRCLQKTAPLANDNSAMRRG